MIVYRGREVQVLPARLLSRYDDVLIRRPVGVHRVINVEKNSDIVQVFTNKGRFTWRPDENVRVLIPLE